MNNQHLEYKSDNPKYQSFENELYLKRLYYNSSNPFKKIIFIFFVFLMFGLYTTFSKEPQYRAVASVMIKQKPGAQSLQNFSSSDNNSIINDKILLIKSRALLTGVVKDFWNSTRRNNMFYSIQGSFTQRPVFEQWLRNYLLWAYMMLKKLINQKF